MAWAATYRAATTQRVHGTCRGATAGASCHTMLEHAATQSSADWHDRLPGAAISDCCSCRLTRGAVVHRQGCHIPRSHHPVRPRHVVGCCGRRHLHAAARARRHAIERRLARSAAWRGSRRLLVTPADPWGCSAPSGLPHTAQPPPNASTARGGALRQAPSARRCSSTPLHDRARTGAIGRMARLSSTAGDTS